ncbi:hypothetical protein CGLO_11206 [Colletotrichum gloeosporioides Cg-14]|uniref:Uncharacterized protein n=1 Tax=Colletotrichum gloeosporioides (strain Cg-14) TaxID=1237896 RepID=T0K8V3_COLGC|nr:hypothetical protein CGLO_11206 [Colletotrichum gloeosporioides Cg-14]
MLLDSFFESEEQKKDFRDEMEDVNCGIVFDPLTDRTCDASSPIWQQVSYFIRVLRIRIKRVSEEFDQVAWKLENALNSKISEFDTQEKPSLLDRVWGQRFNGLILQLIHTMSRVLESWNRLESHEIVALLGPSTSVDDLQEDVVVIHDIRKSVDELREIRGTLLRLQDICNSESQPIGRPPYVVDERQSMTTENRKATTDPTGPVQTQMLRSILQITRVSVPQHTD